MTCIDVIASAGRRSIDRERSITANEFLDRSSIDLASALRDQGPTPAAEAIRRELVGRFHARAAELGEDDREILVMRHFEHLTNSETAGALGLSEAAAGMRYLASPAPAARCPGPDGPIRNSAHELRTV